MLQTLFVTLCLGYFSGGSEGMEWSEAVPDRVNLMACVNGDIVLPWNFSLAPTERLEEATWLKDSASTDEGNTSRDIALLTRGHFLVMPAYTGRVQRTGMGSIVVSQARQDESGVYALVVSIVDSGKPLTLFKRTVVVQVAEPPQVEGGVLQVRQLQMGQVREAQEADSALQLACGRFASLGLPPVTVVWTTPGGVERVSNRLEDGTFYLVLPDPPPSGRYTCSVSSLAPASHCLPSVSPVLQGASVIILKAQEEIVEGKLRATLNAWVSQLEVQFDQQTKQLVTRLRVLEAENQQMRTELKDLAEARARQERGLSAATLVIEDQGRVLAHLNHTLTGVQADLGGNMRTELKDLAEARARQERGLSAATLVIEDQGRVLAHLNHTLTGVQADLDKATLTVAFHAHLARKSEVRAGPSLAPFLVLANVGDAFHAQSGIFTAPVAGLYFLSATAASGSSGLAVSLLMLKGWLAESEDDQDSPEDVTEMEPVSEDGERDPGLLEGPAATNGSLGDGLQWDSLQINGTRRDNLKDEDLHEITAWLDGLSENNPDDQNKQQWVTATARPSGAVQSDRTQQLGGVNQTEGLAGGSLEDRDKSKGGARTRGVQQEVVVCEVIALDQGHVGVSAACHSLLTLTEGQQVWLVSETDPTIAGYHWRATTFTGFLLRAR